jgi:hypothetical protein
MGKNGSCSTGQSPQWAVVPVEEEEEEEEDYSQWWNNSDTSVTVIVFLPISP